MGIPEAQCATWANAAATQAAVNTHASIRKTIDACAALKGKDYEVFLQGSYKNDTNIRGDSDVDIVVQLNSTYVGDTSQLSPLEVAAYQSNFSPADYRWSDLDRDVQKTLKEYFGADQVVVRNKCVTVKANSGRLNGDVVVALQYLRFSSYNPPYNYKSTEGIVFWARNDGRKIVNYPKPHYDNGVTKNNLLTGGNYKPSVRVIKNARTYLRDKNVINDNLAPSYFVEGFLYNIPRDKYVPSRSDTFYNILKWLEDNPNWNGFMCQNGVVPLFGTTPEQWNINNAQQLHQALVKLWNNWGK